MSPHTILEALADAFQERTDENSRLGIGAPTFDLRHQHFNRADWLNEVAASLRRAATKLKPAEPEANIEKEMEKPI